MLSVQLIFLKIMKTKIVLTHLLSNAEEKIDFGMKVFMNAFQ